jgi:hypothetical protein
MRAKPLRSARSLASVRSSSAPASLLYPATSAARMAASFRVSAMAVPSPHRNNLSRLISNRASLASAAAMQSVCSLCDRSKLLLIVAGNEVPYV